MNYDLLLEQFKLDPFEKVEEMFYVEAYQEGINFLDNLIIESQTGMTKQNVFQRLWNFIKKCVKWIIDKLRKLKNFILKIFSGKSSKSVTEIAQNVIGQPTTNPRSIIQDNASSSKSIPSVKIALPKNEMSTIDPGPEVTALMSPIVCKYNKDKKSVSIGFLDALTNHEDDDIPGQGKVERNIKKVYYIMAYKLDDFISLIDEICDILINKHESKDLKLKNVITIIDDLKNSAVQDNISKHFGLDINDITLDNIDKLSNALNKFFDTINNINFDENTGFDITAINNIAEELARFQIGLNGFTATISSYYTIDARYIETIKSFDKIDEFANAMINEHIPPKFIARNMYMACSKDLKGSNADEKNPIWGQSRLVLFPDTDNSSVYKIALSGWGKYSNKQELIVSNKFKEKGGEYLLAPVKKLSSILVTQIMTRARFGDREERKTHLDDLKFKVEQFCANNKIDIHIGDLHVGNVAFQGQSNDNLIMIDYGWQK